MMTPKGYRTGIGSIVLLALPGVATAQQQESSTVAAVLDEITVTAQRREERLQDVPISVSAFGHEQMKLQQIENTEDLTRMVPNLQGSNGTGFGTGNAYSLRGLFNTESLATFDSPVSTYVDGIHQGRLSGSNVPLHDVERIEVLRGPQGTLFGKNTTGGAISVIMRAPQPEFSGNLEAEYGTFDRRAFRGIVNLPINDKLFVRFSPYHIEDNGYVRNLTTGGRNNAEETTGGRLAVRLLPRESIVWDFSATWVETEKAFITNVEVGGDRVAHSGLTYLGDLTTGGKGDIPGNSNSVESLLLVSDLRVDTAVGEIQFLTGYSDLDQEYNLDFFDNPGPTGGFVYANIGTSEQFSQEVKLAGEFASKRARYVTGLFYLREKNTTDFVDVLTIGGAPRVLADRTLFNETESFAAYAQVDFDVTDLLTLTAGARWTEDSKELSLRPNDNPLWATPFDDADLVAAGVPLSQDAGRLTPRVAAEFRLREGKMLFASATRGFKSGGWNGRASSAPAMLAFGPEDVWAYELGLRSEWLDRRLRFNATAFLTDVDDLQIPSTYTNAAGALSFVARNYADLRTKGIELELVTRPIAGLNIGATLGLLDSEYRSLNPAVIEQQANCLAELAIGSATPNCGQGIVTPDGRIAGVARSPDYTFALSADYTVAVTDSILVTPSITTSFIGSYNVSTGGISAAEVDAFHQVSAGVSVDFSNSGWRASVECSNCTDEMYLTSALSNRLYYNEPRRWSVRVGKSF